MALMKSDLIGERRVIGSLIVTTNDLIIASGCQRT